MSIFDDQNQNTSVGNIGDDDGDPKNVSSHANIKHKGQTDLSGSDDRESTEKLIAYIRWDWRHIVN